MEIEGSVGLVGVVVCYQTRQAKQSRAAQQTFAPFTSSHTI